VSAPRIALVGTGRMGRTVAQLATERGWRVVTEIGRDENAGARAITAERLAGADVVIEFTTPASAPANVRACAREGVPVVVGTTGWLAELDTLTGEVERAGGALFWAPNFSPGVNVFWRVAEHMSRLVAGLPGFDAAIVETHHAAKKDAPSGTALELQRRAERGSGRAVPATSVRVGHVPGTHELLFDGPFELLRLEHVARDRRVFAEGALLAAAWLVDAVRSGRRGVFTMDDLLGA
jgi:4-hydroxy-tetrahydrodipicolinate reductase